MNESSNSGLNAAAAAAVWGNADFAQRLKSSEQAPFPMLSAASVVLAVLAQIPETLSPRAVSEFHARLLHESRMFLKLSRQLGVNSESMQAASYALCAALDEFVMKTRWGCQEVGGIDWQLSGISTNMGYDRQGADGFFRLLDEALNVLEPEEELLFLYKHILDLGFQGRTRHAHNGSEELLRRRRAIQSTLQPSPVVKPRRRYVAAVGGALTLGAASLFLVGWHAMPSEEPEPLPALERTANALLGKLEKEIAAGIVELERVGLQGDIVLRLLDVYAPGEDRLAHWAGLLVANAGAAISGVSDQMHITVSGHTDSSPLSGRSYRGNVALSEKRADQVAKILAVAGLPPSDISVVGKGDAEPLADNALASGRKKNRRVEIVISERAVVR